MVKHETGASDGSRYWRKLLGDLSLAGTAIAAIVVGFHALGGIYGRVSAIEANTKAIADLTRQLADLAKDSERIHGEFTRAVEAIDRRVRETEIKTRYGSGGYYEEKRKR